MAAPTFTGACPGGQRQSVRELDNGSSMNLGAGLSEEGAVTREPRPHDPCWQWTVSSGCYGAAAAAVCGVVVSLTDAALRGLAALWSSGPRYRSSGLRPTGREAER
jgi:hypothetical protein